MKYRDMQRYMTLMVKQARLVYI